MTGVSIDKIDNSPLLCEHKKVSPDAIPRMKCISKVSKILIAITKDKLRKPGLTLKILLGEGQLFQIKTYVSIV